MYRYLYIFIAKVGSTLLPFVALFSSKIKNFLNERSAASRPTPLKTKYWIHAASLGEYEMALPLVEKLLEAHLLEDIVITIFSPSGYTQAAKGPYASRLMYLPLDTQKNAKQFLTDYAPQKAIFIRYDFWYNFIQEGLNKGIDFYLINGRFTKEHFMFSWRGKPYLRLLKSFKNIYTSDENSTKLLKNANIKAEYSGDTRYDRVAAIVKEAPDYTDIATFKAGRKLLIVGSSWQQEEELILHLLRSEPKNLAILIAPHDIKRSSEIAEYLTDYNPKLYTENDFDNTNQVLILNTIGMLSGVYRYADFALVGGGFSGALHNILEPAVWGCHLSYGPEINKFPEAQDFINAGFADTITEKNEWVRTIKNLVDDNSALTELKQKARDYTALNIGVTSRILYLIQQNTPH